MAPNNQRDARRPMRRLRLLSPDDVWFAREVTDLRKSLSNRAPSARVARDQWRAGIQQAFTTFRSTTDKRMVALALHQFVITSLRLAKFESPNETQFDAFTGELIGVLRAPPKRDRRLQRAELEFRACAVAAARLLKKRGTKQKTEHAASEVARHIRNEVPSCGELKIARWDEHLKNKDEPNLAKLFDHVMWDAETKHPDDRAQQAAYLMTRAVELAKQLY